MFFDFSSLDGRGTYKLMTSTVVPRPIAWVVTQSESGRINAAPFSFFGLMSGDPPVITIGVGARSGRPKDTGINLRNGGELVVNLVSAELLEQMNVTAIDFGPEVEELEAAGLQTAPSTLVRPPRIERSPVSYECRTMQIIEIAAHRYIVVASVLAMHVRDDAVMDAQKCYIDTPRLDLAARLQGGGGYSVRHDLREMPRLTEEDWRRGQGG